MKKKSIMMFGVAAVFSSALFAGSAFAKVDEDNDGYVAPAFQYNLQKHQFNDTQAVKAALPAVKEKDSDKQ